MYSSNEYIQLRKAQNDRNKDEVQKWYVELQQRYSSAMLERELGAIQHLLKNTYKL